MRMPSNGLAFEEIERSMDELASGDIDWRRGRTPLYVFFANEAVAEVGQRAFNKFFSENALGGKRAFFSVARMEREVVAMALDLLNGGDNATGYMTSGGSESIFLAVKSARDWFRTRRGGNHALNMVLPYSAHPAFNKAAEAMDIEVRRVAVADDGRADVPAMTAAMDGNTFFLLGSAPCFPHGVIDPVAELGAVAESADAWLHVDACVGGYLTPFVERLGYDIPVCDFRVPAVRSLSADLHKYGFCPKPASTVFYRDAEDAERSRFDFDQWPNGQFSTATLVGTRPAGGVAAAWAVLNYLGIEGYTAIARQLMETRDAYIDGLLRVGGFEPVARPDLTIVNFRSNDDTDIFAVAEQMTERGWLVGLTQQPKGMHLMLSMKHREASEDYFNDLVASRDEARRLGRQGAVSASY